MKKFKDTLSSRQQLRRADDHGDPDTAHPQIIASADWTHVSLADKKQARPNNPERFDTELCLLGSAGFTSGRHYWEMKIQERDFCAVGMARESVIRKGRISFSPEHGIWAMECRGNSYSALTSPEHGTPLFLRQAPSKIWVYLDYEVGQVAF
uniref:B30.2/SPRY domain-containing protein n=1 Tax=Pelodiscus sinensis TaxID=13735 RepID=K7G5D2_PELSI